MDIRALLMGLTFAVIWSSAFTSARVIVAYAPPLTALCLRFLISGLIAVIVARMLGQSWRLTRAQWVATAIYGVCQNTLYLGLNFMAMQTIEASLAAIISSTMPLLVAFAGWVVFRENVRPLGIAGLIVGVVGVVVIMASRLQGNVDIYGVLLCIGGVMSLTFATMAVRTASSGGNVLMIVGLQMLIGSLTLSLPAAVFETIEVELTWQLVVAFTYTTIFPGLVGSAVWFMLVRRIGAVKASTYHFLTPFLGVAIAALMLGERLGVLDMAGVAIIAAGIFAVQISKQNPTRM
ncbi:DMT family transporter [Pseudaestuariivita rosea]|uniref:DMT family transporter n=1 Tax=Pseudaestuariivita rosea TaxID=2763263 RepID=UPI001ABB66B1|nr:DMT family transporter [Pseudaestuariivita rosea]